MALLFNMVLCTVALAIGQDKETGRCEKQKQKHELCISP